MDYAATAERLIRDVMIERALRKGEAKRMIASQINVSPHALDRLLRREVKYPVGLGAKLCAVLEARLEKQISALERQLEQMRQSRPCLDESRLLAAAAAVEEAKRLIHP